MLPPLEPLEPLEPPALSPPFFAAACFGPDTPALAPLVAEPVAPDAAEPPRDDVPDGAPVCPTFSGFVALVFFTGPLTVEGAF